MYTIQRVHLSPRVQGCKGCIKLRKARIQPGLISHQLELAVKESIQASKEEDARQPPMSRPLLANAEDKKRDTLYMALLYGGTIDTSYSTNRANINMATVSPLVYCIGLQS
jgi:hypothetical protein